MDFDQFYRDQFYFILSKTSFEFFCDTLKDREDLSNDDKLTMWVELSSHEKAPYRQQSRKLRERIYLKSQSDAIKKKNSEKKRTRMEHKACS